MKNRLVPIIIVLFLTQYTYAQSNNHFDRFSDRLFYGGSIGLAIGSRITQVDILPQAGIWIFPQWSLGLGGRYTYRKERFSLLEGNTRLDPIKTTIWGYSAFTDILPIPDFNEAFGVDLHGGIFLHAELENLYLDRKLFDSTSDEGMGWINMYMVGFGWRQRLGRRAAANFMVLWDLTDNRYSPYTSNPILRFSLTL